MHAKRICSVEDLVANSGVCALIESNGIEEQVALFYLPATDKKVFALGNWDPVGKANVLSRGIVGNVGGELVIASPMYKQHFSLTTGKCIEQDVSVPIYPIEISGDDVVLSV
ncbi:MAG: nitrite reductase small subunit NirD [Gammaproteobacteria bacterium]|nr:nitrite reductase small subunit NirD [Gammaproteobacteria bacterium]